MTWCSGEHRRKSTLNWRLLLLGGVVGLHPSERLFHFAEDPNRVGNQIRRTIAFEPRDQLSLTLNTSALVDRPAFRPLRQGWACHTNARSIQKFYEASASHVLAPPLIPPPGDRADHLSASPSIGTFPIS